jgi:hypothetical protein
MQRRKTTQALFIYPIASIVLWILPSISRVYEIWLPPVFVLVACRVRLLLRHYRLSHSEADKRHTTVVVVPAAGRHRCVRLWAHLWRDKGSFSLALFESVQTATASTQHLWSPRTGHPSVVARRARVPLGQHRRLDQQHLAGAPATILPRDLMSRGPRGCAANGDENCSPFAAAPRQQHT